MQLKAPPLAWRRPWRIPVGQALGSEAMAEPAGYAAQLKAVEEPTPRVEKGQLGWRAGG